MTRAYVCMKISEYPPPRACQCGISEHGARGMGYHDRIAQVNRLIFVSFCSKGFFLTPWLLSLFTYMLFCRLLIFLKINFFEIKIRNTIRVSNSLDSDQARRSVGIDLGKTVCKLSADDTSRQRVNLDSLRSICSSMCFWIVICVSSF